MGAKAELENTVKIREEEVDPDKLDNLVKRSNTYGDICQGFTNTELRRALAMSGNDVPKSILVLRAVREKTGMKYCPPSYLQTDSSGTTLTRTDSFKMGVHGHFSDYLRERSGQEKAAYSQKFKTERARVSSQEAFIKQVSD